MSKNDTNKKSNGHFKHIHKEGSWVKRDEPSGQFIDKRTRHPETDPVGKPRRPKPDKLGQSQEFKGSGEDNG